MRTLEQEQATNVRDIEHIVETVLEEEMFYDYLKSLRIKSAREIITATPEGIRSATYPDENGVTTAISISQANHILTFIAYVKWRNTSPEITERINDDYKKVTESNIIDAMQGSIFHTSSGNYLYDSSIAKMIQDTSRRQSPLSEWKEGVPQDKSLKELVDLDQWLRDSVTSTMAHTWSRRKLRFVDNVLNLGSISKWKVYCTTWGDNYNVDNHDQVHKLLAEMMEIKSWKNISTEGQSLWDMMTEKDKGTILAVITDASKTFQPRTQYPPQTDNPHELDIETMTTWHL